MSFSTYTELKETIAGYLARSDLTTQIPDFIRLAEVRLRRDLRIRQMLSSTTLTCVSETATVNLPSDFIEVKDLVVNGNPVRPLDYEPPSLFSRNSRSMDAGKPLDYTVLSGAFKLAPIPDSNYTLNLIYYAAPEYLGDSNATNVFLVNCPDLLLYASLLEAEPYIMNDARINTWSTLFDRGSMALIRSDEKGQYSGVPLAMRVASI